MLKDTHNTAQARNAKRECCSEPECASGVRNNYFEGKRLTPDTFRVEQRYLLERRQLLNRAIHGWGVVYGYGLKAVPPNNDLESASRHLEITAGLALDPCGRELVQLGGKIALDDVIVIDEHGKRIDRDGAFGAATRARGKNGKNPGDIRWLLQVHYAEQAAGAVQVTDACRCQRQEWDRTCETVRYSIQSVSPEKSCSAPECELKCSCGNGGCCDDAMKSKGAKVGAPLVRGGCRCLCEHLTQLSPGEACGRALCEIDEACGSVRIDLGHGVPLACVQVVADECDGWTFDTELDACGPRRLVKRNDLLFELVRGCDLTRISEIGWKWHRVDEPADYASFVDALGATVDRKSEYVTRDFWVRFSGPVRTETLRPDCFAMSIMKVEGEGGWWEALRVPIVGLDMSAFPPEANDPPDHVRGATIVVEGAWLDDAVRGTKNLFQGGQAIVEAEVRGDFIVDCNGQTVDANAVGLSAGPTGNGAAGGTFLSSFRVAEAPPPVRSVRPEPADCKGASS